MKLRLRVPIVLRCLMVMVGLMMTVGSAHGQPNQQQLVTFRNPLNAYGGADPWLTYYDGNYYLAATTWASELTMRKSPTLAGLKTAAPVRIYLETAPSRCCNMWAPEFDLLDGPDGQRWYFYYTAGTANTYNDQHTHVLESAGTDPLGPYTYKGRLYDPQNDRWAIDSSVMKLNGSLYFLFSASENMEQSIFIAPMSNPWTISGARVAISQPEYGWEEVGGLVNEGPVALHHNDKTFIVFSASSCNTPDYKLGMLTYSGGDPLSSGSWVKDPEPVFQRSDANGVFAPGHNGFFKSPDGTEDWIFYHANDSADYGCDGMRSTRAQKITWNADGTPNFGVPVSTRQEIAVPSGDTGIDPLPEFPPRKITRFRSLSLPDAFLRHVNFVIRVDFNVMPLADSQFVVVPGLADSTAVSIESVNFPGFYVRQQNNAILLNADDGGGSFKSDVTWWLRPGLADSTGVSFESYGHSGSFIGRKFGIMALVKQGDITTLLARKDATFQETQGSGN